MTLEDLRVKPGDPVQPFVENLLRILPEVFKPHTTSEAVRFIQESDGVNVVVDLESTPYIPPFHVTLTQGQAAVREGVVNGDMVPTLKGVPLNGMKDGKQVKVPLLKLTGVSPNDQGWTWVAVRASLAEGAIAIDPRNPDAFTIVHVNDLSDTSLQELALIKWSPDGKTPVAAFQISMHNLVHDYEPAEPTQGRVARHYWSAT